MNELLKDLERQATETVKCGLNGTSTTESFNRKKFADLIIRECLKIVEPDQTSGDEWCVTLDETAYSIRQHFGVKE